MIGFKEENADFFKADEQYILCIANCVNNKLDKTKEPLTTQLFTKFPEANVYKERSSFEKAKPGSLVIKGKIAIIMGTMYPGTKEYANDNREFRLKWFREGLISFQKLMPQSVAVRENFCREFGGDWHKYLFHLNELDKSIKVSIYPYVMAIPIFNLVKFRQEDEYAPNHFVKPNKPLLKLSKVQPKLAIKSITSSKTGTTNKKGFGCLDSASLLKFGDYDNINSGNSGNSGNSVLPTAVKQLLPIKIEETSDVKVEQVKKYVANPDWKDLSNFTIQGWDEIMNDPILIKKRQDVNNHFINTELPKYGDFFKLYPPQQDIFNAFNLCPFNQVKVVIIGQDPYHNPGEAMGLAFSVAIGVKIPPSLRNIFKELHNDIPDFVEPPHGSLVSWAKQGVLLINTALTVREGQPESHLNYWQAFTDQIISSLSLKKHNLVFILWGNKAIKKQNVIKNSDNHHIITAAHPSPLSASRGFFGCKCFSQANNYLTSKGLKEINWIISN